MRPILRLSLILLALFLAITPVVTFAQTSGTTNSNSTTTTTSNGPSSTTMTAPNPGSATTTDKTPTDGTTTTTTNSTTNVPWLWIVVGAIVVVGIVGIVAANGRSETRIVS